MELHGRDAYKMLESYNIPVSRWGSVKDIYHAQLISHNISFPVLMKADCIEIEDKEKSGCLRVVHRHEDVEKNFNEISRKSRNMSKNTNEIILQEHNEGIESVIRVKEDDKFGKVIVFGHGGRHSGIMNDFSMRVIPITSRDAKEMVRETKIGNIVRKNEGSIVKTLLKVAELAEMENVKSLEINPFIIGKNCRVGNARIIK